MINIIKGKFWYIALSTMFLAFVIGLISISWPSLHVVHYGFMFLLIADIGYLYIYKFQRTKISEKFKDNIVVMTNAVSVVTSLIGFINWTIAYLKY